MSQLPEEKVKQLERKAAIDTLWRKGIIHWKLDNNQLEMLNFIESTKHKTVVIASSRQIGKCLIEGTKILTPEGIKEIQDVKSGDKVFGYNSDGSISIANVVGMVPSGHKEVYDLVNHNKVLATSSDDHRWLVTSDRGKTYTEKALKDFKPTDKIARKFIEPLGGSINEPHAYAIGALLGDGCSKQGVNKLHISSENFEVPQKVASVLSVPYYYNNSSKNFTWVISNTPGLRGKGRSITGDPVNCNWYDLWCRNRKAHEKIVELDIVKSWDRKSMLEFLAGLMDTDGCLQVTKNNELNLCFTGQSKSIHEAVQYIIHYLFQYETTIRADNRPKYKNGPCYYQGITNNLFVSRIWKTISPYLAKSKKKWLPGYEQYVPHNCVQESVGVVKKNKRNAPCYDIMIDNETSLYCLANGLVTHNSFFLCLLALQKCLQTPNTTVKYVAPKIKDIKNVVVNHIRNITTDCPVKLRPKFKSQDSVFEFHNGSKIQLAAAENGHIDGIRGTTADLCIIDEAGFCSDLDYAIHSVLLPTTTATGGKIIIASTPARSPDHDFVKVMRLAEAEDRLIKKTIYDNPRLTSDQIQEFIDACGGKETVQFRREYMAENIIDEKDAVVPEFTKEVQEKVIKEWTKPAHFDSYVSMDIGFKDKTAVLFGYVDFVNAKLIIEDEIVISGHEVISDNLAFSIKDKEKTLWYNHLTNEPRLPHLRISDNNNPILLNDLSVKHNLVFLPTLKDNKEAAINNMRLLIKSERIIIHPRCRTLISHLKGAIWAKNRKEYVRSGEEGHYDTIDALVYLCRNINFSKNPFPAGYEYSGIKDVHIVTPPQSTSNFEVTMQNQFKIKTKRRGRWF